MEKEIIKQTEQNETPDNRRTVFIGAKVTPRQKEHIKSLAEQCGMTVSDYILSCAYNFKPKARLTKEEAALLQNICLRGHIIISQRQDSPKRKLHFYKIWTTAVLTL